MAPSATLQLFPSAFGVEANLEDYTLRSQNKIFVKYLLLLMFVITTSLTAQDLPAYQLYRADGSKISFTEMTEELAKADVVLFGELHNNPISHWLQYEVAQSLLKKEPKLVMGAEMLEADNQAPLNLYLQDSIDQKGLDTLARLWNNYKTDYKHLVDLAKDSGLTFIATNVPRRYAKMVYSGGFESLDSLPDDEKAWMAPLPIDYDPELPGYRTMLEMMQGHGGENLPKAQAIKDATMAYFILQNLPRKGLFLHFNGDYHSANHEGIYWYLKNEKKRLKVKSISTVLQKDLRKLNEESLDRADYILVVDEDMTTSY